MLTLGQQITKDTGYNVYPATDKSLLNRIGKTVGELKAANRRYHVPRINEANALLVSDSIDILQNHGFKISLLFGVKYPDSIIELVGQPGYAYLDIKVTTSYQHLIGKKRRFRAVYYTTGEKIEHSGYHLCLRYFMKRKSMDSNVWTIDYYTIGDISNAELRLKHEYSIHNAELDSKVVYSSLRP